MHREPGMPRKPRPHVWVLVRRIIVRDQMQLEIWLRFAVDLLEKAQPFDTGVVRFCAVMSLPVSSKSDDQTRGDEPILKPDDGHNMSTPKRRFDPPNPAADANAQILLAAYLVSSAMNASAISP